MTSWCGRCHRDLTATLSVRRGLGPICYNKVHTEQEKAEIDQPLESHFENIIERFIRDCQMDDAEAKYWRDEAEKAVKDTVHGKTLALELTYEALHIIISAKVNFLDKPTSIGKHIRNMFECTGRIKEGEKQEKYLVRSWTKILRRARDKYGEQRE